MLTALRRIATTSPTGNSSGSSEPEINALDKLFASEVVGKLPEIVQRASTLQRLEVGICPGNAVLAYFAEAHRCYLYGFPVACVVLCRAILESALKERFGTNNSTNELVDCASDALDDERIRSLRAVLRAGNFSIHNHEEFSTRYPNERVSELLLDTRKILEDLYPAADSASA